MSMMKQGGINTIVCTCVLHVLLGLYMGTHETDLVRMNDIHVREYCHWEHFNATCRNNHVIMMHTARYGRMQVGRCVSEEYGHVGCGIDVMDEVDGKCSGRDRCVISVAQFPTKGFRPCPKDVTSYFEASYICQPVVTIHKQDCDGTSNLLKVKHTPGYISGYLANHRQHKVYQETSTCPWILRVQRGQKINITLLDYGSLERDKRTLCRKYATIHEESRESRTIVCGGDIRVKNVYQSTSHELELHLTSSDQVKNHFLLRYEALGCANPAPPKHGRLERRGNHLHLVCNGTDIRYTLHCQHGKWIGKMGNCSHFAQATESDFWEAVFGDQWTSPYGIVVVIALGIGLGIVVGLTLLSIALLYLRWRGYTFCHTNKPPVCDTVEKADYLYTQRHALSDTTSSVQDTVSTVVDSNYGDSRRSWPQTTLVYGSTPRQQQRPLHPQHQGSHIYESPDFNRQEGVPESV